ncbi:MAG: heavy-metal-associated domain-containing protein, partial [Ferruginibacter sp.]
MEKIDWTVDGMTCSNCALSVRNYLEKQGMESVQVDPISGQVLFVNTPNTNLDQLKSGIAGLGYRVLSSTEEAPKTVSFLSSDKQRFLFT